MMRYLRVLSSVISVGMCGFLYEYFREKHKRHNIYLLTLGQIPKQNLVVKKPNLLEIAIGLFNVKACDEKVKASDDKSIESPDESFEESDEKVKARDEKLKACNDKPFESSDENDEKVKARDECCDEYSDEYSDECSDECFDENSEESDEKVKARDKSSDESDKKVKARDESSDEYSEECDEKVEARDESSDEYSEECDEKVEARNECSDESSDENSEESDDENSEESDDESSEKSDDESSEKSDDESSEECDEKVKALNESSDESDEKVEAQGENSDEDSDECSDENAIESSTKSSDETEDLEFVRTEVSRSENESKDEEDAEHNDLDEDDEEIEVLPVVCDKNVPLRRFKDASVNGQFIIEYVDFGVCYCSESRTPLWTFEFVKWENVEEMRHRHWELITIEPDVPKEVECCFDSLTNNEFDVVRIGDEDLYPKSKCGEELTCEYCKRSTFWGVFCDYVAFLTNEYDKVYIWSSVLYEPETDERECGQVQIPSHFLKVIFCDNGDGTCRLECYKVRNEPIDTEHLELMEYYANREELEKATGFRIFDPVPKKAVKQKTRHPCFVP